MYFLYIRALLKLFIGIAFNALHTHEKQFEPLKEHFIAFNRNTSFTWIYVLFTTVLFGLLTLCDIIFTIHIQFPNTFAILY